MGLISLVNIPHVLRLIATKCKHLAIKITYDYAVITCQALRTVSGSCVTWQAPAKKSLVKKLAQKADALVGWMSLQPHEFTTDEIEEIFHANSIPWTPSEPDYTSMVEDGLYPRASAREILEYQRGVVLPESLREKLQEIIKVTNIQPVYNRPEDLSDSSCPKKDQAVKISVLCKWFVYFKPM